MTVNDVISYANGGELQNLAVAKDPSPANVSKVIGYINLSLIELYKRFPLKTSEAIVNMQALKSIYSLDGSDVDVTITDEVNTVLEVYDEAGNELTINDSNNQLGVMTPTWNTIQVPNPVTDKKLSILFSTVPVVLVDTSNVVPIPSFLLEALLHYIGYRAHGAVDGNIQAENNTHYNRFEASCARVTREGLFAVDSLENRVVSSKGFV